MVFVVIVILVNISDDQPTRKKDKPYQSQQSYSTAPKRPEPVRDYRPTEIRKTDTPQRQVERETKTSQEKVEPKPKVAYSKEVAEVQRFLQRRGYNISAVDGIYGPNTRRAIQSFQSDVGLNPDGKISNKLKTALHAKAHPIPQQELRNSYPITSLTMVDIVRLMGIPDSYSIAKRNETWNYGQSWVRFNTSTLGLISLRDNGELSFVNPGTSEVSSSSVDFVRSDRFVPKIQYFTRNDHKSSLLAIHGAPTQISTSFRRSIEKWFYGNNMVVIGSGGGKILRWSILGSMKVKLFPGEKVTKKAFFGVGSHEDDVIRLQGTPMEIKRNYGRLTETWTYPGGWVEIGMYDHIVDVFDNKGGLKVR